MADSQNAVVPFASFVDGSRMEMAKIEGKLRRRSRGEDHVVRERTLLCFSSPYQVPVDSFFEQGKGLN